MTEIKEMTYEDLINMFDSFKTGFIVIGGSWCRNFNDVMDNLLKVSNEEGLDTIYKYDPLFENIYGEKEDLRDCKSLEVKLKYYAIVEKMGFKNEEKVKDTLIARMPVPCFASLKHGICDNYYAVELFKDNNILHLKDDNTDKTIDFENNIRNLVKEVNNDILLCNYR